MSAAVILMAYGSPERLEDVPAYYADILGGRPMRPERLENLVERYRRIGIDKGSQLNAITEQTRDALERELRVPVYTGMKHWTPRIGEAVERALAGGAGTVVGLVLAPHYSPLSVGGYRRQLEQALGGRGDLVFVERWGSEAGFVELLADRVRGADAHVVFTAHSLPVEGSGEYADELLETARLVAERAELDDWSFSFQSESADRRPLAGSRHPRAPERPGGTRRAGRARVPGRLRRRPPRDQLGHRHRGGRPRPRARPHPPAHRDAERRPALRPGARGTGSAGAFGTVGGVIRSGEILIEEVSRRFRVYPKEARTLKELIVTRGRGRGEDIWALSGVSLRTEPGEAVGLVGRNGSGKTTLLKLIGGIIKPSRGRIEVGGRVASLLELGAGFHPEFTGRENVFLNGALHGLSRAQIRERMDEIVNFAGIGHYVDLPVRTYSAGMYMRLGFAVAAHVDADVLLLDEIFAVGDEEFQRKCFGRISQFKQRGGTIVFVSHDAASVERLCERAVLLHDGTVEFDGPTHEAILRYRSHLARDRDPEERGAGLTEWGSGEARIVEVALHGADGEERTQFVGGEQLSVRLRVLAERPVSPPQLQFELREWGGALIAGGTKDSADLGWDGAGEQVFRFDVDELPLAEGRFKLRFGLVSADGSRLYHWLDDALRLYVIPQERDTGLVRMEGRWSREEIGAAAELRSR